MDIVAAVEAEHLARYAQIMVEWLVKPLMFPPLDYKFLWLEILATARAIHVNNDLSKSYVYLVLCTKV